MYNGKNSFSKKRVLICMGGVAAVLCTVMLKMYIEGDLFIRELPEYLMLLAISVPCLGVLLLLLWASIDEIFYRLKAECVVAHAIKGVSTTRSSEVTLIRRKEGLEVINCGNYVKTIPYPNILKAEVCTEEQVRTYQKNPLGNMLMGKLLLGEVGLLIGYMEAQKPAQKKVTHFFMAIEYLEDGEKKIMLFSLEMDKMWNYEGFVKKLRNAGK